MGKLTGPSTQPAPERGTQVQSASSNNGKESLNNNNDDAETTTTTESSLSIQQQQQLYAGTGTNTVTTSGNSINFNSNNNDNDDNGSNIHHSFTSNTSSLSHNSRGRRGGEQNQNRRSGSGRSKRQEQFSNSMIKAVNSAAETARLVLDQAALLNDNNNNMVGASSSSAAPSDVVDTRSISSHGTSHRSSIAGIARVRSDSSNGDSDVCSFTSRKSSGSSGGGMNNNGTFGHGDLEDHISYAGEGWEEDEEMMNDILLNDNDDDDDDDDDELMTSGGDLSNRSLLDRSDTSCEVLGSPPPATAFQNLPMARGFTPTHKKSYSGSFMTEMDDVLSVGKIFEVTNHFDAATAISAALADAHHLGGHNQSSSGSLGGSGELQRRNRGNSLGGDELQRTPLISNHHHAAQQQDHHFNRYPASSMRKSSSTGGSDGLATTSLRRTASGDAATYYANESFAPLTKNEASSAGGQDSPPRRRSSRGLPTKEEAEAAMLMNRSSFVSVDDMSFESDFGSNDQTSLGLEKSMNISNLIEKDKQLNIDIMKLKNKSTACVPTGQDSGGQTMDSPSRHKSSGLIDKEFSHASANKDPAERSAGSPVRRRSGGLPLPSKEEAETEMLKNRMPYQLSVNDLLFGSNETDMRKALEMLQNKAGGGISSNDKTLFEQEVHVENQEDGEKKQEEETNSMETPNNGNQVQVVVTTEERNTVAIPTESLDDNYTSNCNNSQASENESNTSSLYDATGSGTNSGSISAISPITMASGLTKRQNSSEDNTTGNANGVLGNLANTRRAAAAAAATTGAGAGMGIGKSNHSYENADDEYSTQSENSGNGKQHLPALLREEIKNGKLSKKVTISPTVVGSIMSAPSSRNQLVGHATSMASTVSNESNTSSIIATKDEDNYRNSTDVVASAAPAHHVSLFDSFDRNWEQAVQQISSSQDPAIMLDLGRKCFASFAIVFGPCKDSDNGRPIFANATNTTDNESEDKASSFRWWVDEHALTNVEDIIHKESNTTSSEHEEAELHHQGIPIVVIRALWKACFFGCEDGEETDEAVEAVLDSIETTLVKELCYLTLMSTPSTSCLRLSLDVYADYGWYILRRFDLQDHVSRWHEKFAIALRLKTLDGNLTDADSMIKRRYAACSLPRHTVIGVLGINPEGHLETDTDTDTKRAELRCKLFNDLLCDNAFIKARAELMGRGYNRPRDVDETLNIDGATTAQMTKLIKKSRDHDRNFLYSTMAHMKDIEWCASLSAVLDLDKREGNNNTQRHEKDDGDGNPSASSFSDCVDAMVKWNEELIATFHSLRSGGKLSIFGNDNTAKEAKAASKDGEPTSAITDLAKLVTSGYDVTNNEEIPDNREKCFGIAKSLLTVEDAWTMKDNSAKLFQNNLSSKKEFASQRPPRKGRRKHQRMMGIKEEEPAATFLARILNINISDLRSAISIGRSFLGLVEFSQYMMESETFQKDATNLIKYRLHELQSSCLKHAIEVLSCSATTLGYILSDSLDKLDEDDLDDTVKGPRALLQLFAMTREASKPLLSVAGILSADAWFLFGRLVGNTHTSDSNNIHVMLICYERALLVLNSPKSNSLNKPTLDLLCESLLSPLTQYKCYLQSNINHSVGVYSYEQGDFARASEHLDKSAQFRRQMLDDLGSHDSQKDVDHSCSKGLSQLFDAVVGGMKSHYLVSPGSMSEDVFTNVFQYSIGHSCVQLPRETFSVNELELSLSLTLEYSALTQHAGQMYQQALSFFQESLILRTMHVGKHSLDVASLHFNMGVVYDDLEQYDQAISRYHESLRIRLNQMNKATSPAIVAELEDSVLLTLKCMGHVYKIINDMDNAICCYVKVLDMLNTKRRNISSLDTDEWSKMSSVLAVPVPTIFFEEIQMGNTDCVKHFQMMNKKELCHVFEPRLTKRRSRSTASKLKKELIKIHSTIIDLTRERKQDDNESSLKMKLPGSSLLLASLSSTLKTGGDAFEAALMRSSFSLGRMRLEQTRYEEAADHLETALRSKWVIDPASSSDSDSDFSRRSLSSRNKQAKSMNEDDPEEGQIYYALGICNAALDDHERAVRCFLTAMRYLRRSLRKVDSLEVARVLFDCATSHYYLCNFDQSVSLYGECLRILTSYASQDENKDQPPSADDDMLKKTDSFRRGIVLYCLVMAKKAIGFDSEASNLLNEAQILLSDCNDKIILAYMEFLTGTSLHHAASQVPIRLRSITRISPNGLSLNDGLSWTEMCQSALTLFEQVKNECWFDPMEAVEDSEEVKHLPLSGHICFKKGQVYELIGSVDQALNSYVDAANFYRIACGDENMYVASVLHRMGMICSQRTEYHALGYFNEALSIRKNLLGGNDHLVADTLFSSAVVLARLNRYEASMERYHEALRIQMADSQDSNEVARTLAGMGICHYNHRAYDLALTCLEGAVKIRKYRVSRLTDSVELVELYGEEVALGADFFNLGNVHMQMGDYTQAMQCIIQSRDLRWRHVGSGTVDKILDKYFSEATVDEDELLGLAHCLHNVGVMFDIKKEYNRSLPHYEEALAIKNAIAGFSAKDSMSLVDQLNPDENQALVLQSLYKDQDFPRINKATLSASVTRQKIATVYVKQRKYDHALFHYSHALRIQRQVLGKDHFRIGALMSSMGNALRRTSTKSETAIICYNESLRISKLRFGQNHATVASALFDIGNLYDSNQNFGKAMHYYQRALSVYKQKYSQDLRQRLCSGLNRPISLMNGEECSTEILSTGDEITVARGDHVPEKQIKEQYVLVTEALRKAKRQDTINRGDSVGCIGDSNDAWLTFEVLLFRFVEMLSTFVVDPAQTAMRDTIDYSRRRIESAAAHAVISAADALDYQFLLLMQD